MDIITSIEDLKQIRRKRPYKERIGFVPTMGFLHQGHTSLMDIARQHCDQLIVSIFVNPLQFAPNEDLDRYPRDPEGDAAKCKAHGTDILFMPDNFYPADHSTTVQVNGLSHGLCGASRPTHFNGVTTVVARLFGLIQPDVAVFGEKDYQQLAIIRRMVRDMAMPIEIIGGPLVRDHDGLALSSRNRYLSPTDRQRALSLNRSLRWLQSQVAEGKVDATALLEEARSMLDVDDIDYLEIRDPNTLESISEIKGSARAFVAAKLGQTRLIDNMELK